jgi:pyrroloquinoline quinone biosynthesis protein B
MRMRALVLGAAAGGGLPQWNCGCANCFDARTGALTPQTQSSLAVTSDGQSWTVFNASPDIRAQLAANPQMWPKDLRTSPLTALIITNGDIDHIGGLLTLREKQPFTLFLTDAINAVLNANPVFSVMDPSLVTRRICQLDQWFDLDGASRARLFAVPGKVPLFMEGDTVEAQLLGEQTVGIEYEASGARMLYIPGCAAMTDDIAAKITAADLLFFDGTLYTDDEMIAAGLGQKTGLRMGHMPMSGSGGSLETFKPFKNIRKIYVHMNNTNPVWAADSAERAHAHACGWDIGHDGMEIDL